MNNSTMPELAHLSWYDYTLFSAILGISALIGVYFGFVKKQSTPDDYLLGGKQMSVFPIALSLVASVISGSTLLALPSDVYRYGSTYIFHIIILAVTLMISYKVYLPVFYKLQLTSTYEYLELRFNAKLRQLASFLFTITMMLYLPIVIYAPALAFSQATGTNLYFVAIIVSLTCVFYTTIGGLKAVVWTDAVQFLLMVAAIVGVLYLGVIDLGGITEVFKRSYDGGRITYDYDWDPTKRDTFWAIMVGSSFTMLSYTGMNQGFIQKCLALPTIHDAKKAMVWFLVGTDLIWCLAVFTGLIIYARYADCDPFHSNKIEKHDQILPLYILEITRNAPGLSGLYLSGLFSAALSTLSASMNYLSGTVYEDFVSNLVPKDISKKQISNILKLIVLIIGLLSTFLSFFVERMGSLLPMQFALSGISAGPILGIFTMGLLIPFANSKGALSGGLASMMVMAVIVVKAQMYQMQDLIYYDPLPVSVEGCEDFLNSTIITTSRPIIHPDDEPFFLFRISYYYYTMIGTLLVFLVGIPVSYFTRNPKIEKVHPDLISPVMHWALTMPESDSAPAYYSVEKALFNLHGEHNKDVSVELKPLT